MKLGNVLALNARRYADEIAVVCQDRRLTFAMLDERANRFANALLARGVKPGDRVVISLPNGIELVEAMAGVLKMGALIVPLTTRLTAAELAYIVADSEPAAFVYGEEQRPQAAAAVADAAHVLRLVVGAPVADEMSFTAFLDQGAPSPPPPLLATEDDCVVGYTSGTTGRPKGAVSTHANIIVGHGFINALEWGLTQNDVVFATTPMAHRTGLGRLANMFYLGCRLVIQPRFDAAAAVSIIEREKVTVIGSVPTVVRMLMPELEKRPSAAHSVRLVVATGEAFPVQLKERLRTALPHVGLYSFLSQTESGMVAGLRPEEQLEKPDALGRPVAGVDVRLIDDEGRDVPTGEVGEIVVRCGLPGHGTVMRAYFRNEEATRAAFVGEWFRTGDIGYFDDDGFLYFADRAKDMIVTGGLNVYSKEVEAALAEHAAVDEAAVIGVPDPEFGEAVVACVVLRKGTVVSVEELVEHCRQRIASYKKPKHIHFVADLPRNGTGKVMKPELKRQFYASAT